MKSSGWVILGPQKSLQAILNEVQRDAEDGAKFGFFDLACLGLGGTVGAGVFVLSGQVVPIAGPAATVSWAIAGVLCLVSALAYVELSARIPTKGSSYAFAHHALGELPALIGAVCLTFEYGLSAAGVAKGWSLKVSELLAIGDAAHFDWVAGLILVMCAALVSYGMNLSKLLINVFSMSKVLLILFMTVAAWCMWDQDIFASSSTFFAHGAGGTIHAASLIFMGYIGFDEVCCLSSRAHNPQSTVPRALVFTIVGATVISVLAQLALVGIAPATAPTSFEQSFGEHGFYRLKWVAGMGEMALMPLVVLISFLAQPELMAAMAEDGLAPAFFKQKSSNGTYLLGATVCGVIFSLAALFVRFDRLWDFISIGVLFGFNLTNSSLIMVRAGNGGQLNNSRPLSLLLWLWFFGAVCAFSLSHGFVQSTYYLVLGIASLILVLCVLVSLRGELEAVEDDSNIFHVPFVPFLPGLSIVLNFALMTTFSSVSLKIFGGLVVAIALGYAFCTSRDGERWLGRAPRSPRTQSSTDYGAARA